MCWHFGSSEVVIEPFEPFDPLIKRMELEVGEAIDKLKNSAWPKFFLAQDEAVPMGLVVLCVGLSLGHVPNHSVGRQRRLVPDDKPAESAR